MRADAVHNEYLGHARALDRRHHATAADARGPVEAALRRYGAVVGLTFGAYGEQSKALKEMRHLVARKHAAANWRAMGAVSEEVVYSYLNRRLRRRLGATRTRRRAHRAAVRVVGAVSVPRRRRRQR